MFPKFDSLARNYTFHYDESNNHRSFMIKDDEDAYNIDSDPCRKSRAPTNFMLAGVACTGSTVDFDFGELMTKLSLSPNLSDLKFGTLASGSFWECLKSEKLRHFLNWLVETNFYIHTSHFNIEYWAFIDIVQDCIEHAHTLRRITFIDSEQRHRLDAELKDALHHLIMNDKSRFLAALKKHTYPDILGREAALIRDLIVLTEECLAAEAFLDKEIHESLCKLKLLFCRFHDIADMSFTLNSNPGVLIDDFSPFYINRLASFPHSVHFFDSESKVQGAIDNFAKLYRPEVRAEFVNSKESTYTQLSDVVAGLFAKYFEMINIISYQEIDVQLSRLNKFQHNCFELMRILVDRSDAECEHFIHYVLPRSEIKKHRKLMYNIEK